MHLQSSKYCPLDIDSMGVHLKLTTQVLAKQPPMLELESLAAEIVEFVVGIHSGHRVDLVGSPDYWRYNRSLGSEPLELDKSVADSGHRAGIDFVDKAAGNEDIVVIAANELEMGIVATEV